MSPPHDMPTAVELVAAVREFLQHDVMPATEGRVQWHTRVAVNVLGMVARELEMGPAQARAHAAGLARLGSPSEAALSAAIRDGSLPEDRLPEVAAFLRETITAKLSVANPGYLAGPRPAVESPNDANPTDPVRAETPSSE